jgi:broad specificity phosphatase PhoE/D-serine deaminase-like pyridoxal phosphate-dependent protein
VHRLALAVAEEDIAAVYSSDLLRALETAQAVARGSGDPVVTDTGLRERGFGSFEGMSYAEINERWPEMGERWRRRDPTFGAPGGETLTDFYARSIATTSRLAAQHPGQTIAIVSHGGVMDCLYRAATRVALDAPARGSSAMRRSTGCSTRRRASRWSAGATPTTWTTTPATRWPHDGPGRRPRRRRRRRDRHAGAGHRPRRDGAQPRRDGHVRAGTRPAPAAAREDAQERAIAQLQMRAGAVGVCVQKVGEAEALADAGVTDIYISNEVIDAAQARARRRARGRVTLADRGRLGARHRAARAGAEGDRHALRRVRRDRRRPGPLRRRTAGCGALAHQVVAHGPALRGPAGVSRPGPAPAHAASARPRSAMRHAGARRAAGITSAGIACPLVTGAGSGSFVIEAASGVYGELQCGSYLFMDRDYADNEPAPGAPRFEHALFVKSQVMSRGESHAVVDAGHKAHAIDSGLPRVWRRDLAFANGGDEHGILMPRQTGAPLPALGETVWLVPGHCDPTVNLHDHYIVVRGGLDHGFVEAIWPVDARGRLT